MRVASRIGWIAGWMLLGLGLGSFCYSGAAGTAASYMMPPIAALPDTSGTHIDLRRDGEMLHVRGLFVNADGPRGVLTYELAVHRAGPSGTSRSTQSGAFDTVPGQTDTLSTVQVNIQPGDSLDLRLRVEHDDHLLDEARIQRTVSP